MTAIGQQQYMAISPDTKSGFSLLEVLVALSLLAIVLTLLLQGFADGLANVRAGDNQLQAAAVAEGMLAQVGTVIPLNDGNVAGDNGHFQWSLAMTPTTTATAAPDRLFEVQVEVIWQEAGRKQWLELRSLRARQAH